MRIVLLAHSLRSQGGLVLGRNFIKALSQITTRHQYLITIPEGCGYEKFVLPLGSRFLICPGEASLLSRVKLEMKTLPSAIKDFKADVVFGMGNHGIKNIDCPQAIFVQNGYLVYPMKHFPGASFKTRCHILMQRYYLNQVLKKADRVFCQTPTMQQRIADYYGYDKKKIKIIPNVLPPFSENPPGNGQNISNKISNDYFNGLILSKYYLHKNPEIVIEACRRVPDSLTGLKFITTISPDDGPLGRTYLSRVEREKCLRERICNIGPVPYEELAACFQKIQLLIMPTLVESFSVSYLEAMYFGIPILTTDLDFAHYICGDAALYYNPWNVDDFIGKVIQLKSDLALRVALVEAGKIQFCKFDKDWRNIVETALDELEKI
jgi:glycosyltransferase involved in cell wall biosynthesis